MKKLSLALSILLLAGCMGTELSTKDKTYNASTDARIRIFGQNGRPSTLTIEHNGNKEKITIGGGVGQAFSSLVGAKGNESIGMPESVYSKDPSQFSNIGSTPFFKEFIIPANAKVNVKNEIMSAPHVFKDVTTGKTTTTYYKCSGGKEISFVAEAGKNYEVIPSSSTNECGVTLNELN
ncbi:hypothetical protein ACTUM7_06855 [Basfia succiniciproducens]|uniref:hypothetical protein n=1 Tax=Basfia succiniciproducens TaxID=653940 RepID=UPI003FCC4090